MAAARPGENAMSAPRPDDRAALNLAAPSGSTAWPRVDLPFVLPGAAARLPECANRHRKKVVVSQPQFARLMVVSSETVKKWEQNKNPIPASVGYWVVGLKVRPGITKKLLFELAGRSGVRSLDDVGPSIRRTRRATR
jgi:hypothetical protein